MILEGGTRFQEEKACRYIICIIVFAETNNKIWGANSVSFNDNDDDDNDVNDDGDDYNDDNDDDGDDNDVNYDDDDYSCNSVKFHFIAVTQLIFKPGPPDFVWK